MRILHVIDGIDVGGAELVLAQLIEHLQRDGHHNTVLVLTHGGPIGDRMRTAGAAVVEMGSPRGRLPVSAVGRMAAQVRKADPDLIQGWMYHGNLAALILRVASRVRSPLVWSMHNTLEPFPEMGALTRGALVANRLFAGAAAGIVYVSEAAARQHERRGFRPDRTRVIPNGTDCQLFGPRPEERAWLRQSLGVPEGVPLVGTFARWATMKGHGNLFAAVSRLKARGVAMHLVLAGSGTTPDNPELAAGLLAAGLTSGCSCLGVRHDVPRLMAGLDAFVLPSVHGEAFPLVLGEAMATEVPCIATDVGDARLILGSTGEVVPPGDVEALASALGRLLALPPEQRDQIGRDGRDRVMSRFSLETMGRAYESLYRSVIDGSGVERSRTDAARSS